MGIHFWYTTIHKRSFQAFCLGTAFVVFMAFVSGCALQSSTATHSAASQLTISEPPSGVHIPANMASPLFAWDASEKERWKVSIKAGHDSTRTLTFRTTTSRWIPTREQWTRIQQLAPGTPLTMEVVEQNAISPRRGIMEFTISQFPFDGSILYLQVPTPFSFALKNKNLFRWKFATPESFTPPETALTNLPYCANCHTFSRDGSTFGLDMDNRGDKGGYVLTKTRQVIPVTQKDIISWSHLDSENQQSMGLFARISPQNTHVLSTVHERPFFVGMESDAYSQLFFPIEGQIGVYNRTTDTYSTLHGADRTDMVQTSPAWSADGTTVAFARAPVSRPLAKLLGRRRVLPNTAGENIHQLNAKYQMQFDLYTVPFANGSGGVATPLEGASHNGKSNYFPRYSPDSKWIVYCQSETGLVSQPSSKLYIVPATGGPSRMLGCNNNQLNSWHSFSPNGRWLVFSSKADDSPFTQTFITNINEQGEATPALRLHRLHSPNFASIIPEILPAGVADDLFISLVEP